MSNIVSLYFEIKFIICINVNSDILTYYIIVYY